MSLRMRQLEARVEELETRLGAPVPNRLTAQVPVRLQEAVIAQETKKERKPRRERKISDVLTEGETVYARIPLGNRLFHEFEITYSENAFSSEGITNTNLNKLLVSLAKKLEEDEMRDPECKSPLNAWTICSVQRGDKKILLDKVQPDTEED